MLNFDGMKDEYLFKQMEKLIKKSCATCLSSNHCRQECIKEAMEIKYELVLRGDFEILTKVYEILHKETSSLFPIKEDEIKSKTKEEQYAMNEYFRRI